MDVVHACLGRRQATQQGFDFGMLAGVGGEHLDEPVIIRLLFQPNLTRFETFAGELPEFWLDLFRRQRSKVGWIKMR